MPNSIDWAYSSTVAQIGPAKQAKQISGHVVCSGVHLAVATRGSTAHVHGGRAASTDLAALGLCCAGGALLICEMLLDESGTSPPEVLLQSLNMLAQTYGRERKLSEFCHLLETAGFRKIEGKKTGAYLDVILAYKTLPGEQDAAGV